jgi:hypothetical protein
MIFNIAYKQVKASPPLYLAHPQTGESGSLLNWR